MTGRAGGFYALLVVAVLAGAAGLRIYDPSFLEALRLTAFDVYQQVAPRAYNADYPVRVVDIDAESLERIGPWPWPRTTMADLLSRLAGQRAASVAFDILFTEPDQTSPETAIARLPPEAAARIEPLLAGVESHDTAFARAVEAAPTVLAAVLTNRADDDAPPPQKAGFTVSGDDPAAFVAGFTGATANLPGLDAAADGIGAINWTPDRDQVVRRLPLVYRLGEAYVPALAAEALRVGQRASAYVLKAAAAGGESAFGLLGGLNHVRVGDSDVPTDAGGGIWLKYRPSNPAAFIPAWRVLAGENDAAEVGGRIILVGSSAPGLADLRATPLEVAIPGVEIQAMAIEHILSGETLTRPDFALPAELAATLALGLVLALLLPRVQPLAGALLGAAAVGAILAGGWFLYKDADLLFDPSWPALAIAALVAVATVHIHRRVESQRSLVREALGHYVAPAVVDAIVARPDRLILGGEVRELSLLFCQVRNFSALAEKMEAADLTRFVNALLTPLSHVILTNYGTIDKYMGDAVMAFWNAPLDDPDHAVHACQAAVAMVAAVDALNETWHREAVAAKREFRRVQISIGLNTGDCCVGNLGSEQRFDYSAIGDNVDTASRLEGLARLYGVTAVIAEATAGRMPKPEVLELDLIRLKGRTRPTRVFTLAGAIQATTAEIDALQPHHARMLACYRGRDWDGAATALAECRKVGIDGLHTLYALYRTRIITNREISPPADWDGADRDLVRERAL